MKELFTTYTGTDIIIFVILLALAIKGLVTFIDWAIERLRIFFNKEQTQDEIMKELKKHTQDITELKEKFQEHLDKSCKLMNLLIESDKDDIKAWITEKHHYYCYVQKYIDDYSLDCLEKRFKHYEDEGGNSFVSHLMDEIRQLPRISISDKKNK